MFVRSFTTTMRFERYRAAISMVAIALTFSAALVALGLFTYVLGGMFGEEALVYFGWITRTPASWLDELFAAVMTKVLISVAVLSYLAVYVLPVFLMLPLIGPLIGLWQMPARILVLRPFNRGWPGRALKRIVRHDLSRAGHVYTLADMDIRIPWVVRATWLFGQFSLFSFRPRVMRTPRGVARLRGLLQRTGMRNLNWTLSFSKIFPLRSNDAVWQQCISELLPQMDIIVVDISQMKSNLAWELQLCESLGLQDRIVYLASDEHEQTALTATFRDSFGLDIDAAKVCVYGRRGVTDRRSLRRAIDAVLVQRQSRLDGIAAGQQSWAIAAVACFSLGFYPLLPLAFYPETSQDTWRYNLPFWSPWSGDWPQVTEVLNAPALALFGFGVFTLLLLAWAGRRSRAVRVLLPFQSVVVLLTAFGYFPSAFLYLFERVDEFFR